MGQELRLSEQADSRLPVVVLQNRGILHMEMEIIEALSHLGETFNHSDLQ